MIVEFDYYLHDDNPYYAMKQALKEVNINLTDELYDKIGKPFYEIHFRCSLDTDTGEVRILTVD
jgi:hypothetical protein